MIERISDFGGSLITAVAVSIVTAGGWLVRRVLTNERQIAILEDSLRRRDKQRDEDRQDVKDVKSDIKEIKYYIMTGGKT